MNAAELFRHETNPVQLAPGEFLYREGDNADNMYVLLEGEIDIRVGDYGKTAREGALIGEAALIEDRRRAADAVAISLPTGANRPAEVRFSCSAAPAVCDACDEISG